MENTATVTAWNTILKSLGRSVARAVRFIERKVRDWTRPERAAPLPLGLMADLTRSKRELLAENALLRQQLIVARRQFNRPKLTPRDRLRLLLLARLAKYWRDTILLVKPDTVLRWHRAGFRLLWRRKARAASNTPRLSRHVVTLITRLSQENRLWGAERIRGELLKLAIRVSKRTIQKHMRPARGPRPSGQRWATFLHNHSRQIWACDFLQTYSVLFRPIFAFFIVALESREVVWFNVTRSPCAAWVAQQLRNATPWGAGPRFLIRDNDDKFGPMFDRVADTTGITVLHTPVQAPRANAVCERFVGSVRRECLDHLLILGERRFHSVLTEYVNYANYARPHQGLEQRIPSGVNHPCSAHGRVVGFPVLGGLHHDYRRAA